MQSSYIIEGAVFLPVAAGLISYGIGRFNKNTRNLFADIIAAATFILCGILLLQVLGGTTSAGTVTIPYVCGMGLHFTLDGFRAIYGTIAAFMWFMTTLFSGEYFGHYRNRNRYYLFLLLTLGATEGIFFSADFYTTFIFFEIMSLASYVWVAHDEKPDSLRAAGTYLAVAVIGGLVMLMGIFLLYNAAGTLFFADLANMPLLSEGSSLQIWAAGFCLLFGFGAKAGAFPLHIWLPKAHPVAPAPASALLSGILTKAGMYGILILTSYLFLGSAAWGAMILLLGVLTMVVGAVLALFSIDLKRTLACSSVSQIGFILVGVGMSGLLGAENGLALRGSLLHMVNHSLIKLALFMAAGVVFMNVHKLDLNEIQGFGRHKPLLNYIFLMGALGISGVPLWNGYVSKTLIHESIVEYCNLIREGKVAGPFGGSLMSGIEWIFLISGGLTAAYMLKLYVCLFLEKNTDPDLQKAYDDLHGSYMNRTSALTLTLSATLLPIGGFLPNIVMDGIADLGQGFLFAADAERVSYFSLGNLRGSLISMVFGLLIYGFIVRPLLRKPEPDGTNMRYVNRLPVWLDLENVVYRPVLLQILPFSFGMICRFLDSLVDTLVVILRKTIYRDEKLPHELAEGTPLTHLCACIASAIQKLGNLTIHRKNPRTQDYEHRLALFQEEW
ncbi:MAG: sodium:proton antiporter, partial [Lachnospiraceae bacterium]|nr:sodium:proton antiporter [Lachnospiraceae bacterium]